MLIEDCGGTKCITRRYEDELEDRELEALALRYSAGAITVRPPNDRKDS